MISSKVRLPAPCPEAERLENLLSKVRFHRLTDIRLVYLKSVDSTQTFMSTVLESDREGELVISEIQTGGKGREGRSWASPKGGLWTTIALKPPAARVLEKIIYTGAKAIVRTLEEYGLTGSTIKPPNDIYCNGKKIAGILADTFIQGDTSTVYLGVGMDVNNDPASDAFISQIATSVSREIGHEVDLSEFTVSFLTNLDEEYSGEIESHISLN